MKKWIVMLLALCLLLTLWVTASADGYGWYVVESTSPYGYAYLYSNASDRNHLSRNLGRYDNGSYVYVINYYGGRDGNYNYCYVQTVDGRYGYMHDYALRSVDQEGLGWFQVQSTSPYGYAYLYSAASDRDHLSSNLGRYDNGSYVYVINYYGGQDGRYNYCYVRTVDGRVGYMHDYALASMGSYVPSFDDIYTPTVTPTPKPVTPQLGTVYITTSSGNARSGPGAEYSQVAYVNYGEVYDVYETRRASNGVTWFKIIVNGRYCWISSGLTNTGKY